MARITGEAPEAAQLALSDFAAELADRFGPLPKPVQRLEEMAQLRIWASGCQIDSIHVEGTYLVLGYRDRTAIEALRSQSGNRLRVVDATSAYLPLARSASSGPATLLAELKSLLRPVGSDR